MRKIEFRGKRIVNGKWVYGYYIKHLMNLDKKNNPVYEYLIANTNIDNTSSDRDTYIGWRKVSPKTVGQYTGLKDKNGEEIYEGDILKHDSGSIVEVFYNDELATYTIKSKFSYDFIDDDIAEKFKIIGNKYENPELLKEG